MIEFNHKIFRCKCGGKFDKSLICSSCANKIKVINGVIFTLPDEEYVTYLDTYKNSVVIPQLEYLYQISNENKIARVHIERLNIVLNSIESELNKFDHVTSSDTNYCVNNVYANEMNNDNYIVSSYTPYIDTNLSFSESHYSTILRLIDTTKKYNNILDIGCGMGRVLKDISEHVICDTIWGCDVQFSKLHLVNRILNTNNMVDYISIRDFKYNISSIRGFSCKNTRVFYADLNMGLPLDDYSMDIVIISFVLGLLDDFRKGLINVVKKIKNNGVLIIADDYGWHSNIRSESRYVTPGKADEVLMNNNFKKIEEFDVPYLGQLTDRVANAHIIRLAKYIKIS